MTWWIRSLLSVSCLTLLAPMAQAQVFHHKHTHHGYYTQPNFLISGQALPVGVYSHALSYSPVQIHSFYATPMAFDASAMSAQAQVDWLARSRDALRLLCKTVGETGNPGGTTNTDLDRRLKAIEDRLKALEGPAAPNGPPGEFGRPKEFPGASALAAPTAPRDPLAALMAARDQTFLATMRHKQEHQAASAAVGELIRYYTDLQARIETFKPK